MQLRDIFNKRNARMLLPLAVTTGVFYATAALTNSFPAAMGAMIGSVIVMMMKNRTGTYKPWQWKSRMQRGY